MSSTITDRIRKAFADYNATGEKGFRHFAILVPVTSEGLLYEVRAAKLDRQPGEICFPGGMIEEGETPQECALRETEEETGISRENVEIITRLDSIFSTGGSQIHCFLGIVKDGAQTCINPKEVEELFSVSVDSLLQCEPEVYENQLYQKPDPAFPYDRVTKGEAYPWRHGRSPVPVYDVKDSRGTDRIIWGLTGRITKQFLEVLKCSD